MQDFDKSWHKTASQKRSKDAIDSILEAAVILAQQGRPELMTARQLSKQSGYSAGAIYHYFEKIDDVFIALLMNRRRAAFDALIIKVDNFPVDGGLKRLCAMMINFMMDEWCKANPKVLRLVLRQFFKRAREPENINAIVDVLIVPIMSAIERDTTGELPRHMSEQDLRLQLRAVQAMVRSPFFEADSNAGSEWHRNIVISSAVRLFSA